MWFPYPERQRTLHASDNCAQGMESPGNTAWDRSLSVHVDLQRPWILDAVLAIGGFLEAVGGVVVRGVDGDGVAKVLQPRSRVDNQALGSSCRQLVLRRVPMPRSGCRNTMFLGGI